VVDEHARNHSQPQVAPGCACSRTQRCGSHLGSYIESSANRTARRTLVVLSWFPFPALLALPARVLRAQVYHIDTTQRILQHAAAAMASKDNTGATAVLQQRRVIVTVVCDCRHDAARPRRRAAAALGHGGPVKERRPRTVSYRTVQL
jgi:hypothetical protein